MQHARRWLTSQLDLLITLALCAVWNTPFARAPGVGAADWPKELFFFAHIRAALVAGHLPRDFSLPPGLAASDFPVFRASRSYFANPEVFTLSPFLPLLRFVGVPTFLKVLFLAHSVLGCVGMVLLGRRLGLHPIFRVTLAVLTALNPWVMQHWALGYTPHINFLLAPWVAFLLLDPARRWRSAAAAAAVAALMVYQGGAHVFLWTMLSVGLFAACALFVEGRRGLRGALFHLAFAATTALLAAPKIVATMRAYRSFRRGVAHGLLEVDDIFGLLADPSPIEPFVARYNTCLWDGSLYMSWTFVIVAGLALLSALYRVRSGWAVELPTPARRAAMLGAVSLVWLSCGWGTTWASVAKVFVWFDSEIYPYRFVFLALLALIALVVIELDALFAETPSRRRWVVALALVPVMAFLRAHYAMHTEAATRVDPAPILQQYEQHFANTALRL